MNNEVKSEQLGIPFGTASARLRKNILFNLLKKHNENYCFKCGKIISSEEELSIEHKIPWLHSENPIKLFFDIDNIAFSHLSCNVSDKRCLKVFKGLSKYKGIYYDKTGQRRKRWRAVVQNGDKIEKLGRFLTEIDAAKAYDKRAKEIFGDKAVLNFE
jgi:hypothetical protein